MPKPSKSKVVPLETLLDRLRGRIAGRAFSRKKVKQLAEPYSFEMWFPGQPVAKSQGWPKINYNTKPPTAYIAPDKTNQTREDFIREQFLVRLETEHPDLIPYLPVVEGAIGIRAYFLMRPPETWYPGKQHVGDPDDENLLKILADALAGRQKGKGSGSYLHWDDCIKIGSLVVKEYWDPRPQMGRDNHYPREPGSHLAVTLLPLVRDPSWLPREEVTCESCGRHDFKSRGGFQRHAAKCKGG